MTKTIFSVAIAAVLSLSATVQAEHHQQGAEALSPELQRLLKKEMVLIQGAMKDIVQSHSEGNSARVAQLAEQIKDSFILKQQLTEHQRHELHQKLPADFVKQDQQFHYFAGMLSHVASNNKTELVSFYYAKMFEACATCHQQYAQSKFPHFNDTVKQEEHGHHH